MSVLYNHEQTFVMDADTLIRNVVVFNALDH